MGALLQCNKCLTTESAVARLEGLPNFLESASIKGVESAGAIQLERGHGGLLPGLFGRHYSNFDLDAKEKLLLI